MNGNDISDSTIQASENDSTIKASKDSSTSQAPETSGTIQAPGPGSTINASEDAGSYTEKANAPTKPYRQEFSIWRFVLWIIIVTAWLVYIIPMFTDRPKQSSGPSMQQRMQTIVAGKIMRLLDSQEFPAHTLESLKDSPRSIMDSCREGNSESPYILYCSALECMHRHDYKQAQKLLEGIDCENEGIDLLCRTTLRVCLFRSGKGEMPELSTADALLIQESINSWLKDYLHTIASRELAECAKMLPMGEGLSEIDKIRLHRDMAWVTAVSLIFISSTAMFFFAAIWLIAALIDPQRRQRLRAPISEASLYSFDPLRVCATFVASQWLMAIIAIAFSGLFYFKSSPVTSVFCTYFSAYAILTAFIILLLPYLASAGSTPVNALTALQLRFPRWSDLRWGWIGFCLAVVSTYILSQIMSVFYGKAPQSDNPFLQIAARSRPSEWFLLIMQLSLCGPFFEELVFRGLLFGCLRSQWSFGWAALFSSLIFGIVHGDPQGTIILAGLGLCFVVVYHKSGSIWSSTIAHGLWNGFVSFNILYTMS
ncbi:CPBP family intramembrane metalloprotease, partial [bacterium]|nr:CPBP family intramembrane metalloprotease [bacterium]